MALLLDQLVYTSFAGMGFRLLAGEQVPTEIQEAFMERVVSQRWDSYAPPKSGYRAVYLHQVTPEQSLFGWLYNDGVDDMKRTHLPYFICYYLRSPLHRIQLENIFTCLHKGPVALADRQSLPASLETLVLQNFWTYQPVRSGVAIPLAVRKRSHIVLKQGELLDVFVPVNEKEMADELNQQKLDLSIYTNYLIEDIETDAVSVDEDSATTEAEIIQHYAGNKERLQQYEQALVEAITREHPISDRTRKQLKHLQQLLQLSDEDTNLIEACLPLNENVKLIPGQAEPIQPLEKFVGVVKKWFLG